MQDNDTDVSQMLAGFLDKHITNNHTVTCRAIGCEPNEACGRSTPTSAGHSMRRLAVRWCCTSVDGFARWCMRCVRVDEDRHDIHVISSTVAASSASRHAKDGQPRARSGGDRLGGLVTG
jgi:hypothetical protein